MWDWFDDLFVGPSSFDIDVTRPVAPACDIEETDTHFVLCLDMPGIPKEDIAIHMSGNQLTVEGERSETKGAEASRYRSERYASFRRSFTLPAGVDTDRVEANYKNGVLEIAIPKGESAKTRRIKIGGEAAEREKITATKERAA